VPPTTLRRIVALTVLASLPLLGACERFSPASTEDAQTTSEGALVMVGAVRADSLIAVASAKGETGMLSGALVNTGSQAVTLQVAGEGGSGPVSVDVPGNGLVRLGTETTTSPGTDGTTAVPLPALPAGPGSYVTVVMASSSGGQVQVQVPVVSPQGVYATITPAPTSTAALG
jgi:hypothetical protein